MDPVNPFGSADVKRQNNSPFQLELCDPLNLSVLIKQIIFWNTICFLSLLFDKEAESSSHSLLICKIIFRFMSDTPPFPNFILNVSTAKNYQA